MVRCWPTAYNFRRSFLRAARANKRKQVSRTLHRAILSTKLARATAALGVRGLLDYPRQKNPLQLATARASAPSASCTAFLDNLGYFFDDGQFAGRKPALHVTSTIWHHHFKLL
jgi:hypothetical protein